MGYRAASSVCNLFASPARRANPVILAGPGGQLWLASKALRKFALRSNTLVVDSEPVAIIGHHPEGGHLIRLGPRE